jgi:parallel beta-helix repeat protein
MSNRALSPAATLARGIKSAGICTNGSAQGEVEGNACRNNRYDGIYADEQSRLVARNNTCEGNKGSGISLFGSAQGEVSGNTCRNNRYRGIYADEQSRLVARNNTCEGNKQSGISLFGSAQGEVSGNACRNNGLHGIAASQHRALSPATTLVRGIRTAVFFCMAELTGTYREQHLCGYNQYGIYSLRTVRAYVGYNECYSNSVENILLNQ